MTLFAFAMFYKIDFRADAKSKLDKYVHLGMEFAGSRDFGEFGTLYDLIKYPDNKEEIR